MQKRYKKPPITEAILDLRVTLPEQISLERLRSMHSDVKNRFPTIESFDKGFSEPSKNSEKSLSVAALESQIGFRFRSEDALQTLQVTTEGLSFNQLAPYESWEKFSNDFKTLWELYKEICEPKNVTRVSLRYVNQINIPIAESVELKEYLRIVPEVPSDLPQRSLQTFFMQVQIPQEDLDCMLIINEGITPPIKAGVVTVVLDLDLFRQQNWESSDEDIWRFLESLRHRKNEVFEASITDKTRELIG